jgi:hypothetical protein
VIIKFLTICGDVQFAHLVSRIEASFLPVFPFSLHIFGGKPMEALIAGPSAAKPKLVSPCEGTAVKSYVVVEDQTLRFTPGVSFPLGLVDACHAIQELLLFGNGKIRREEKEKGFSVCGDERGILTTCRVDGAGHRYGLLPTLSVKDRGMGVIFWSHLHSVGGDSTFPGGNGCLGLPLFLASCGEHQTED